MQRDPGSFRDPSNAVYLEGTRVLRGLDATARDDWSALAATGFFARALADGRVVGTIERPEAVAALSDHGWATALEHEHIPYRSYPYEWSFSMLQDAALAHLGLLAEALGEGFTMADGTAYNVQWRGAAPVFIDVLSFRPDDGGPWPGYRQFCQTFLFPLLIQSARGVPARLLLRSQLEGVTPAQARRFLGPTGWATRGALRHVYLHALADRRMGGASSTAVHRDLADAGFDAAVTSALVEKLTALVGRLRWKAPRSGWSDYGDVCSLTPSDREVKAAFVRASLSPRHHGVVWDLGCNDGTYSTLAAEHADLVVAVDADEEVVDRLYRQQRQRSDRRILPLVVDLLDPSPALGWRGHERPSFADRGRPDVVLALALVHHLALAGGVPLVEIVDWLASLGGEVVLEVPHRSDPMVERLLGATPAGTHDDYGVERIEALVGERFTVAARRDLPSGSRTLFHLVPSR